MSDFGVIDGIPRAVTYGAVTGSSTGTIVTGGAANTYGSWVQLSASTPFATGQLIVGIGFQNKTATQFFDIGVGAPGSEVIVVDSLYHRCDVGGSTNSSTYRLPIAIPAGSRLCARLKNETTTTNTSIMVTAISGGLGMSPSFERLEQVGGLVQHTNGVSANTKCAWVTIAASTTKRFKALHLAYQTLEFNASRSTNMLIDLAIGSSGSEVSIIENLFSCGQTYSTNVAGSNNNFYLEGVIPAGTRIAGRFQSNQAGNVNCYLYSNLLGYS